jgi:hypothetical protein
MLNMNADEAAHTEDLSLTLGWIRRAGCRLSIAGGASDHREATAAGS